MPEKPSDPGFDRCNKCSWASHGPMYGRSPTTHAEICCLYCLSHPGPYDYTCCKACPGLTAEKQQAGPAREPREAPQDGILDLAAGCETEPAETRSQLRKHKKIEPRLRLGFKKYTIELRPRRFKRKLWFGTYSAEEIDRAQDAVNYYMGCNLTYKLPDSPQIFASKPLKGIKFEDLQPSCDDWIKVGDGKPELKYKYFARQVKDVIHSITGKQRKSVPKRNKCKGCQTPPPPPKLDPCDPITPSGTKSTTSSGTPDRQLAEDRSQEADSELSAMHPSYLFPPAEMLTSEDEMQISELLRSGTQKEEIMGYTLEEMFTLPAYTSGEITSMDEEDFSSEILWIFQNEGLP